MLNDVVAAALKNKSVSEVIVVDNNSHDSSMDLLHEHGLIKKYFRKHNHGFASSCNYGAQRAKSNYILFLNPDCFVEDTSIDDLLNDLKSHKNAGIIGCRINNPDGTEQRASRRRLPTLWRAIKTFSKLEKLASICNCFAGVNLIHQTMPTSTQKVEAISGAFILMKTEAFKKLKGFDEGYPLHFEDLDLFKRILDRGYGIFFNPNVQAIHHQGQSSKSNPKVSLLKKQGLKCYFAKHCSKFSNVIMRMF